MIKPRDQIPDGRNQTLTHRQFNGDELQIQRLWRRIWGLCRATTEMDDFNMWLKRALSF